MTAPADRFEAVIFDADDTLWRSEDYFRDTEAVFAELVAPFAAVGRDPLDVLHRVELANVAATGYGVLPYTLSMVEAAVEASDGMVPATVVRRIVERGYEQLRHPVELLDGVAEVLDDLASTHRLFLVTKGDLMHQRAKLAASGIADRFERTRVVSEKDTATYAAVFADWDLDVARSVMIGNSIRSDVVPILELGGHGVHVPYHTTWAHEVHDDTVDGHTELASITEFAQWFRGR